MYGDNAYARQKVLIQSRAPQARDFTNERARKRKDGEVDEAKRAKNRTKSKVRAKVEHMFAVVKQLWGLCEGALPRLGQECVPRLHGAGVGEYLPGAPSVDGTGAPVTGESGRKRPPTSPQGQ
nr:hypothetical protein [Noviherbaspirillum cavernae]